MAFLKGFLYFLTLRWGTLYRHIRAEYIKTIQKQAIIQSTATTGDNSITSWVRSTQVIWNRQMDCWECEYTVVMAGRQLVITGRTNKALNKTTVGSKY